MGNVAYQKTIVTATQMKAALQTAFPGWSDQAYAVIGAMWALETGNGLSEFNFNPAGVTGSYQGANVSPPGMTLTFRAYPDIQSGVNDWLNVLSNYPNALAAAQQGDLVSYTSAICAGSGNASHCKYVDGPNATGPGGSTAAYTAGLRARYAWWLANTPAGPVQLPPAPVVATPSSNLGTMVFVGAVAALAGFAAFAVWPEPAYALLNPILGDELLLPPNKSQQENAVDNKVNWIVDIDPNEFLKLTVASGLPSGDNYPTIHNIKPQPLAVYKSPEAQANMVVHPHLRIDKGTGKITGHEGRHRAAAVMNAGGKWYRIGLQIAPASRNYRPTDMPIIWTAQFTRYTTSINELVRAGKMRIIDQNVQKEYYRN